MFAKGGHKANDYEVLQQIDKVEWHLKTIPSIRSVSYITMLNKSINLMNNNNQSEAYKLPDDKETFEASKGIIKKMPRQSVNVLLSKYKSKARIATRILDLGADSVMATGDRIDQWIVANTESSVAQFRRLNRCCH